MIEGFTDTHTTMRLSTESFLCPMMCGCSMYMSRSLMTECVRPNLAIRSRSSMCFEGRNVVAEQAGSRSRFREKADTANDAEVVSFRASSLFSNFNTMSNWV